MLKLFPSEWCSWSIINPCNGSNWIFSLFLLFLPINLIILILGIWLGYVFIANQIPHWLVMQGGPFWAITPSSPTALHITPHLPPWPAPSWRGEADCVVLGCYTSTNWWGLSEHKQPIQIIHNSAFSHLIYPSEIIKIMKVMNWKNAMKIIEIWCSKLKLMKIMKIIEIQRYQFMFPAQLRFCTLSYSASTISVPWPTDVLVWPAQLGSYQSYDIIILLWEYENM